MYILTSVWTVQHPNAGRNIQQSTPFLYNFGALNQAVGTRPRFTNCLILQSTHMGIKGLVKDANNNPVASAMIVVEGIDKPINTTSRGEYWRLLAPGNYRARAMNSDGKFSDFQEILVPEVQNSALRVDFLLYGYGNGGQGFEPPKPVHKIAENGVASEATSFFSYLSLVVPSAFFAMLF